MNWNVDAVEMRYRLLQLTGINDISVVRTAGVNGLGYIWTITFEQGTGNEPLLFVTSVSNISPAPTVVESVKGRRSGGVAEIQKLVLSGASSSFRGYFKLSFNGAGPTNYISADASNTELADALNSLSTVGQATVTKSSSGNDRIWLITFGETWHGSTQDGDLPALLTYTTQLVDATLTVHNVDSDGLIDTQTTCPECRVGETPALYSSMTTSYSTFTQKLTSLNTGTSYKVQVSAKNKHGYGPSTVKASTTPPLQVPGPPLSVALSVVPNDPTSIYANYSAPSSNGGSPVLSYQIQYSTSVGFSTYTSEPPIRCTNYPKRHRIKLESTGTSVTGGFFKITLNRGGSSVEGYKIPWNAKSMASEETVGNIYVGSHSSITSAAVGSLQSHLEGMSNMNSQVSVSRTDLSDGKFKWIVTFLADGNDFTISSIDFSQLTGTGSPAVSATQLIDGTTFPDCTGQKKISSLNKGVPYYVRVLAYNTIGFGAAAMAPTSQKPMTVPGLPLAVSVSVETGTALRVSWNAPSDNGGDTIDKYKIEWDTSSAYNSGCATCGNKEIFVNANDAGPFTYLMTPLVMGTTYYIRISAHNSQGYGSAQAATPEKPHEAPSAPQNVILAVTSDKKITVKWDAPASTGGDTVTKYVIEWDTNADFSSMLSLPHKSTGTETEVLALEHSSYTIPSTSSLTTGQTYYVRVAARNAIGYGVFASPSPVAVQPSLQVPGKPSTVSASTTSSSINVAWAPPLIPAHGLFCGGGGTSAPATAAACPTGMGSGTVADGGSAISSYKIQHDTSADFSTATSIEIFPPFSYTKAISGLQCGNTYYIRIAAANAQGYGAFCGNNGANCNLSVVSVNYAC